MSLAKGGRGGGGRFGGRYGGRYRSSRYGSRFTYVSLLKWIAVNLNDEQCLLDECTKISE